MKTTLRPTLLVFFLSLLNTAWSQSFVGEASLPVVEKNGYYQIIITENLTSFLTDQFANLRLVGDDEVAVPYIVSESDGHESQEFTGYPVISNTRISHCCTVIVVENSNADTISNVHLRIKNADIAKEASLLGSNDQENWFAIRNRFRLSTIHNSSETTELRMVGFPPVDYRYLKIEINDSLSAPLNILSVGYYKNYTKDAHYHQLMDGSMAVHNLDRDKQSHIRLKYDTVQWIDRLEVKSGGFPYFDRKGILYSVSYVRNKKGKVRERRDYIAEFRMANDFSTIIDMKGTRSKELLLVVENDDSPPLTVESVAGYQIARSVIAYLDSKRQYKLKFGTTSTSSPVYDLSRFKDRIGLPAAAITPGPVKIYGAEVADSGTFFTSQAMWIALASVILLLGVLSVKMIRDLRPREEP